MNKCFSFDELAQKFVVLEKSGICELWRPCLLVLINF